MKLHCLELILKGNETAYDSFTQDQGNNELSWESFRELYLEGDPLLRSGWNGLNPGKFREAMETALVLRDIGKSEEAREFFFKVCP